MDLGCGDFNWMKNIIKNNHELYYLGIEIVQDIVNANNRLYSSSKIKFKCADAIIDKIEYNYDLIIVRDLFIHIKIKDVIDILKNIQLSSCKFYAVNNFPDIKKNNDVKGYGHHRLLNIEIDPFNLNETFYILEDYDRKLNIYKNV